VEAVITTERHPINDLELLVAYDWLGQDQSPPVEALTWPAEVDYVAVGVTLQGFDEDGEAVEAERWWPAAGLLGFVLDSPSPRRPVLRATGLFRARRADTAEANARAAVVAAITRITTTKMTRQEREAARRAAAVAAGLPAWVRSTEAPDSEREKGRSRV